MALSKTTAARQGGEVHPLTDRATWRREFFIWVLVVYAGIVAATALRVDLEWPADLVAFVGFVVATWVVAVVVTERRLPRFSLAELRRGDESFSGVQAFVGAVLWPVLAFTAVALIPPSSALREWAAGAWYDVLWWAAWAVGLVTVVGVPAPPPGSLIDRALAQVERLGHLIDEGRALTREEAAQGRVEVPARPNRAPTPPRRDA